MLCHGLAGEGLTSTVVRMKSGSLCAEHSRLTTLWHFCCQLSHTTSLFQTIGMACRHLQEVPTLTVFCQLTNLSMLAAGQTRCLQDTTGPASRGAAGAVPLCLTRTWREGQLRRRPGNAWGGSPCPQVNDWPAGWFQL